VVIKLEELIKLSPQEFYKYIKNNIRYGFVDKTGKKYYPDDFKDINIDNLYILQSPKQVISNKCAWCWDVVELLRYYLDSKEIYNETYYIEYKNDKLKIHHTHTFIIFSLNNKWYNIEDNSSSNETGVFEYNLKDEVISSISNSFKLWIKKTYNLSDLSNGYILNQYSKPIYGITAQEFQNHCKKRK